VPVLRARRAPLGPVYEDYVAVWKRMEKWAYEKTDIMLTNIQSLIVEELNDEGRFYRGGSHNVMGAKWRALWTNQNQIRTYQCRLPKRGKAVAITCTSFRRECTGRSRLFRG
jgi:hypothetical protein